MLLTYTAATYSTAAPCMSCDECILRWAVLSVSPTDSALALARARIGMICEGGVFSFMPPPVCSVVSHNIDLFEVTALRDRHVSRVWLCHMAAVHMFGTKGKQVINLNNHDCVYLPVYWTSKLRTAPPLPADIASPCRRLRDWPRRGRRRAPPHPAADGGRTPPLPRRHLHRPARRSEGMGCAGRRQPRRRRGP